MSNWMTVVMIVAGVVLVIGVLLLLFKGRYQVLNIELGIPPKMTIVPRSSTAQESSRSVIARRESEIDGLDMTDSAPGRKSAQAEDKSKLRNIKM